GRCVDGARESAHRARRLARGAVPVLHRRLHDHVPGKGLHARADDRSRARCGRHPRRRLARARRADAKSYRKSFDVAAKTRNEGSALKNLAKALYGYIAERILAFGVKW